MKFVNDINIDLAWKVTVQEVTDSMKNHELTGEWGVYAHFLTANSWGLTVLVKKFDSRENAVRFKREIQGTVIGRRPK